MNPLDFLLIALGIFIFVTIIYYGGLPPKREPAEFSPIEQLNAKRLMMEMDQAAKEDGWIRTLEAEMVEVKARLILLRDAPDTIDNIKARGAAVVAIEGAERVLKTLYARRDHAAKQSAAVHFEGRM
jgi:hypothetical protein